MTIATTNVDGSPNLSVVIPGISQCGNYLVFGMEENRTGVNFVERKLAVVSFYEYNPPKEIDPQNRLATGDRGCRVIVQYPGDEINEELNVGRARPAIFMEIVEVLPLG